MGRHSQYTPEFKAKVALAAIKEDKTLHELSKEFNISPSKITEWKQEAIVNMQQTFINKNTKQDRELDNLKKEKERMLKKIGQLQMEVDFFAEACEIAGLSSKGKH